MRSMHGDGDDVAADVDNVVIQHLLEISRDAVITHPSILVRVDREDRSIGDILGAAYRPKNLEAGRLRRG